MAGGAESVAGFNVVQEVVESISSGRNPVGVQEFAELKPSHPHELRGLGTIQDIGADGLENEGLERFAGRVLVLG